MFGWGRSSAEGLIAPHERSRGGVAAEAVTGSRSVRIVVVGDSGVGKSSLVHVVCERSILRAPTWTVGCTLNAQLYRPRVSGVGEECFVEWVDVGGSSTYAAARSAFYDEPIHGLVLVHDLTNRRSNTNLRAWVKEVLGTSNYSWEESSEASGSVSAHRLLLRTIARSVPALFVGTKRDMVLEEVERRSGDTTSLPVIMNDEILVSNLDADAFAAGTLAGDKLTAFLDHVVRHRFSAGPSGAGSPFPLAPSDSGAISSARSAAGLQHHAITPIEKRTASPPRPRSLSNTSMPPMRSSSAASTSSSSRRQTSNAFPFESSPFVPRR